MPIRRAFLAAIAAAAAPKLSPVERVKQCLSRIEMLNPSLNAMIAVMADRALQP